MEIHTVADAGIRWLKKHDPAEVKDLSRSIQALSLWDENASHLIDMLLSKKKGAYWDTERPVLDTARACSALAGCGIMLSDAIEWIKRQQNNGNWDNNEIETSYALITLGNAGIKNEQGCEWLFRNYGEKWEHVGTTSLILMGLMEQNRQQYAGFIKDRVFWLLSKRNEGGWTYIATSNLVLQSLILSGEAGKTDIDTSIHWLLGKQNDGNWGDITSTALSLISLGLFFNKVRRSQF